MARTQILNQSLIGKQHEHLKTKGVGWVNSLTGDTPLACEGTKKAKHASWICTESRMKAIEQSTRIAGNCVFAKGVVRHLIPDNSEVRAAAKIGPMALAFTLRCCGG